LVRQARTLLGHTFWSGCSDRGSSARKLSRYCAMAEKDKYRDSTLIVRVSIA
jgi:hypothetical protein